MDPLGLINKVQHGADDQIQPFFKYTDIWIQWIPQLNIYMSSSSAFSSINTDTLLHGERRVSLTLISGIKSFLKAGPQLVAGNGF